MALSTGQKWWIGCGGCLGVVILIVALIVGGLAMFHQGSVDVVARILGKEPAGFLTIFGIEPGKSTSMAMLASFEEQELLVLIKSPQKEAFRKVEAQPDTKDPQKLAELQSAIEKEIAESEHSRSVDKFQLESVSSVTVAKKRYKVLSLKVANDSGSFVPGLAVLAPLPDKQGLVFCLADMQEKSTDPQADFTDTYAHMSETASKILAESSAVSAAP